MVDTDTIRRAIAGIKAYAEENGPTTADRGAEARAAEMLAEAWWRNGDHAGHSDWDILSEDVQAMWTQIAHFALREIETGEPTPE